MEANGKYQLHLIIGDYTGHQSGLNVIVGNLHNKCMKENMSLSILLSFMNVEPVNEDIN